MQDLLDRYPGISEQLDDSEPFANSAELATDGAGRTVVVVTQTGELTSGQALFRIDDGTPTLLDADTVVQVAGGPAVARRAAACGPRPDGDYETVATKMRALADYSPPSSGFPTEAGPDKGNLACVWALARVVRRALDVWITREVSTTKFADELTACFGRGHDEAALPAGAIVISPTGSGSGKMKHGHVGLLGEGSGGARAIYSNSSKRRRWERNWTLDGWKAHYGRHLDVLFFPLPTTGGRSTLGALSADEEGDVGTDGASLVPFGLRWLETLRVERVRGISFERLKAEYRRLYDDMVVDPARAAQVDRLVDRVLAGRARYGAVSTRTGVPWHVIGTIHLLEGSLDFGKHLHNGDPLSARTVRVPRGRPRSGSPPFTWEESATDALEHDDLTAVKDWSVERTAFVLEGYNGWGYRLHHPEVKTPYLWSFSNHHTRGKYVGDGLWDPNAVSRQCGAMVLRGRMHDRGVL